jgi:diguanylate cyclase (GGDEF)-like protein/PAS domain S-box-containing protein
LSIVKHNRSIVFRPFSEISVSNQQGKPHLPGSDNRSPGWLAGPAAIVTLVVLAMSACVLGLVVWKALDARTTAQTQNEHDIRNLAHSLAEHASHTLQAADVAMSAMVDLLKYQRPRADRFGLFLRNTVDALPQLREIGVLDADGNWIYSSLDETPHYSNADRPYFIYHRDTPDTKLRIGDPLLSRTTGRPTIPLSKRINNLDGSFGGVLIAGIDSEYFTNFYKSFKLGPHSGITLVRGDGIVLTRWPLVNATRDFAKTEVFQTQITQNSAGYYRLRSPFDGLPKFWGYEHASQYPLILIVARTEDEVLAGWRTNLRSDVIVAAVLMCSVFLLAILLSAQLRARSRIESTLRESEARYRLLADNIADVVILIDRDGALLYVSQSVEPVLGLIPENLVGRLCFELVHPDDLDAVKAAAAELTDWSIMRTLEFRAARADGSFAWVEINFKLASNAVHHERVEVVGVLRDVTRRKLMEDELKELNARLAELATTDGLTDLANRRTFDAAIRREFSNRECISVVMLDIDNFKEFNDRLGHQAGDECLKRVANVIADATQNTSALSARYGGEEFAIILPDVSEQGALKVAEAIRLTIRSLAIANPAASRGFLSISLGIASRAPDTTDETRLVGAADLALYEAKRLGRNCSVVYSSLTHHSGTATELLYV